MKQIIYKNMDIFLIILAGILLIVGFAGVILPLLPGLPISYVGILLLHFTKAIDFTSQFLTFWALVVIVVQVLDYYVPIWGTKKFGGSKRAIWGSSIGLIVGLFIGPIGIIVGPFVGAFLGELTVNKSSHDALKVAWGSFVGILIGTTIKLIVAGFFIYYYAEAVLKLIF